MQHTTRRATDRSARPARSGSAAKKDAIALLKSDHRQVEEWFEAFEKSRSDEKKAELAQNICGALRVHTTIEEEIFYPAFLEATGDTDLHHEAAVEHAGAKALMDNIESSSPEDEYFDAKVKVLAEMIKHHVKEEERFNGMFTKARLARMDLRALGILLEARKKELAGAPQNRRTTAPKARGPFMGAAALARSKSVKPQARRNP